MRDNKGRFVKGHHYSPQTEFKKGQHWRSHQSFRDKEWLYSEYIDKKRSTGDIAKEFGVTDAAILFWLSKHNIPRRTVSQARKLKKWGLRGSDNPMYGKRGALSPSWKGGVTAERQLVYSSREWLNAASVVWKRDRGVCRRCGCTVCKVHLHHILSFEYEEGRTDPNNLVTLCIVCHRFVHSRKNKTGEFIKRKEEV